MKKLLCILISATIVLSIFTALPLSSFAAAKKISLKKASATLKISKKKGKNIYGSTTISVKKAKGVTVKKKTFKTNNKKIATVSSKGKVTAKKKGSAKIAVKVKYKYKKKTYTKSLTFKVTVKDTRKASTTVTPSEPSTPANPTTPTTPEKTEPIPDTMNKRLSAFSNKLYAMCSNDTDKNYAMSPISIYMALAMLYSVGDDNVKSDIESLSGMSESDFAQTGEIYKSLVKKYYDYHGEVASQLSLSNSIWIDNNREADEATLKNLADTLYCQSKKVPFKDDNNAANETIRKFIKDATNGLIDQNFELEPSTLFALINTLYFKDEWDSEIQELPTKDREFTTSDSKITTEFLTGKYVKGRVQKTDTAQYFYATTEHGYKVKFILPKDGYTLKEAMSESSANKINTNSDYKIFDKDGTEHFTRCIFPSFKIESDTPLADIFKSKSVLTNAFNSFASPLMTTPLQVSDIKHKVVLNVDKKGVEGAAVTIIVNVASSAMPEHKMLYHDFVLNKSFGFIITDPSDVILFEGQVTNPKK